MPRSSRSSAPAGVRVAYALAYAVACALSGALVARPALLWVRGLGLRGPVLGAEVPWGPVFAAVAAAVCVATLRLALAVAARDRPRIPEHAALLLLLGCGLGLRGLAPPPRPPADPAPGLRAGLAAVGAALETSFSAQGRYQPLPAALTAAAVALPSPGFALHGRRIPLSARVIANARGPQLPGLTGDLPGTVYVAVSPDESRAWLTVLTLQDGRVTALRGEAGRTLILQARGGTHGEPGQDALLPRYPAQTGPSRAP